MNNLLYIDYLKAYTKISAEIERFRAMIEKFSIDIAISFSINKWAVVHMKARKNEHSPVIYEIPMLSNDESCKYLGIIKNDKVLHEKENRLQGRNFSRELDFF